MLYLVYLQHYATSCLEVRVNALSIYLDCFSFTWYFYIYYQCLLHPFVDHHSVWLISHHRSISLDLEFPQDLSPFILNHLFLRSFPFWSWSFQSIFGTVHSDIQLVMAFHVCVTCLHRLPLLVGLCPHASVLSLSWVKSFPIIKTSSTYTNLLLLFVCGTCYDSSSSSFSSSLGSCCPRHSLTRSSLGAVFLMYSWIFIVSSWRVAH